MLDIDGFLTSTEFISQLATFLTAIWTAFFGSVLTNWLGTGAATV
jgi:hypothetical protein